LSASRAQRADETGYLWTFLNEARDPGQIKPGAIIVAGDQDAAAVCEVIDLAPAGDGTIVHHEFADRRDLAAAVTVWTPTSSERYFRHKRRRREEIIRLPHTTADQAGSRVRRCGAERYQDASEELHMARKPAQAKAPGYFAPVSEAKYIVLTTFRRDGEAVSTPVHVAVDDDTAFFRTWNVTGKAKRLRHTPAVEIAPSTFRGRQLGSPIRAQAHLLDGEASEAAARMLAAKHPILHGRLIPWYHRRRGWTTQQYRLEPPATVT
jgi:PPOX class probable F420-dependent enzyme